MPQRITVALCALSRTAFTSYLDRGWFFLVLILCHGDVTHEEEVPDCVCRRVWFFFFSSAVERHHNTIWDTRHKGWRQWWGTRCVCPISLIDCKQMLSYYIYIYLSCQIKSMCIERMTRRTLFFQWFCGWYHDNLGFDRGDTHIGCTWNDSVCDHRIGQRCGATTGLSYQEIKCISIHV